MSADRKKDLVKLSHGEYVSLGKVEAALKQSKFVENCCAYGDSREIFIILLVVPVQAAVEELASSLGLSGSFEDHCVNKEVIAKVLQDIHAAGKLSMILLKKFPRELKVIACFAWHTQVNDCEFVLKKFL